MAHAAWTKNTICELTLLGTCFGAQVVNVHHFEASATMETGFATDAIRMTEASNLITLWNGAPKTAFLAAHQTDYAMTMVRSQIIQTKNQTDHRLTPVEAATTSAGTAVSGTPAEAAMNAACLRWRSALAGKTHRGRSYLGPVRDDWMSNGLLTAGGQTIYNAYITAMNTAFFQTDPARTGWTLTIYSRPYNKMEYGYVKGSGPNREFFWPEDYNGDSSNVIAGALDPVVRTQRRRQIGVGA